MKITRNAVQNVTNQLHFARNTRNVKMFKNLNTKQAKKFYSTRMETSPPAFAGIKRACVVVSFVAQRVYPYVLDVVVSSVASSCTNNFCKYHIFHRQANIPAGDKPIAKRAQPENMNPSARPRPHPT